MERHRRQDRCAKNEHPRQQHQLIQRRVAAKYFSSGNRHRQRYRWIYVLPMEKKIDHGAIKIERVIGRDRLGGQNKKRYFPGIHQREHRAWLREQSLEHPPEWFARWRTL